MNILYQKENKLLYTWGFNFRTLRNAAKRKWRPKSDLFSCAL